MLTGIQLLNSGVAAATKTLKPVSLWGSSLKVLVLAHPVAFLALTGSSIVTVGIYTFAAQKIEDKKKESDRLSSDVNLVSETAPIEEVDSTVEQKETKWNVLKKKVKN